MLFVNFLEHTQQELHIIKKKNYYLGITVVTFSLLQGKSRPVSGEEKKT